MELLSVREAASRLGLHEQTIYRKISRGEISCRRIGRTIRIPLENLAEQKTPIPVTRTLPSFLSDLFWDVDFHLLDSQSELSLERILEYGDLASVRWLFSNRSRSDITRFIRDKGKRRLSKKSLNYWQTILETGNVARNSHRDSEKTLGKTGWR